MHNYDVVIVGAGPAGSRTARDLAGKGFDVAVLEEHTAIGDPCHCSGLISPRALELAGTGTEIVLNQISGATFHHPEAEPLRITGNRVHALVIDRVALDRRLAEQAAHAGARIITGARFDSFRLKGCDGDGRVEVTVGTGPQKRSLSASVLVGADGARSRVASQLRGGPVGRLVRGLGGVAAYGSNPLTDHVELFIDEASAPGWFAWTIPVQSGISRFGVGSANGLRPRETFELMRRRFPESFGSSNVMSRTAGSIPLWEPGPMAAERILLVGDAARQAKPASGGGILTALMSGAMAAETIAEGMHRGDFSLGALNRYLSRWRKRLGGELKRQHDMRRALLRLNSDNVGVLMAALRNDRTRRRLERFGDIDLASSVVRSLLINPSLLLKVAVLPRFPAAWLTRRRNILES